MQVMSHEFNDGKGNTAYHDVATYENGDIEHFVHLRDSDGKYSTTRHSTAEKALKRIQMHGFNTNTPANVVTESVTTLPLHLILAESVQEHNETMTKYAQGLVESGMSKNDAMNRQRQALFEMVYAGNLFESIDQAGQYLNSSHATAAVNCSDALIESADVRNSISDFKKTAPAINESFMLLESAPAGQEDWIKSNKAAFIKQYGEKDGMRALYATAWKRHNLHEGFICETVMDTVHVTDDEGNKQKVSWKNEGGFHSITTVNKNGSTNYHAIGDSKDIAAKWAKLKGRLAAKDAN